LKKLIDIMKRLSISILLYSLFSLSLNAQGTYGKVSAQTADFVRYGNIPVSLYTGQASASVPLYHLQDPDFDIPFELKYASDGLRPAKRAGWTGLDWVLSGGGVITREVYGVPDDYKEYTTTYGATAGLWEAAGMKQYSPRSLYEFEDGILRCYTSSHYCELPVVDGRYYYDCDPDLFMFSMPGHSGRFVADSERKLHTSVKGYRVDLSKMATQYDVANPNPSQISITAPDGYIYTFGSLTDGMASQEYSFNFHPSSYPAGERTKAVINAWHLTCITAPNGRKLLLHYASPTRLNMYDCEFLVSSRTKKATYDENGEPYPNLPLAPYRYQATKVVFLESVEIPDTGFSMDFLSGTEEPERFYKEYNCYNLSSRQLEGISVKWEGTEIYRYSMGYEVKGHLRFLKKVTLPDGGVYSFDYQHCTYPTPSTTDTDPYGHWSKSGTLPCGMMTKLTYPTKGYTTFEYEPHAYGKKVAAEVTASTYSTRLKAESGLPGGFRIKHISHYATDGTAESKSYEYLRPDKPFMSSGILLKSKPYSMANPDKPLLIEAFVWNNNYNVEEPYIGYSYVKEIRPDGSFVRYYFSDYQVCPDNSNRVNYHWADFSFRPSPLAVAVSHAALAASCWDQRGFLLEESRYDSEGRLRGFVRNSYKGLGFTLQPSTGDDGPAVYPPPFEDAVCLRSIPGGAMAMRIPMASYPLMMKKTEEYPMKSLLPALTHSRSYKYNANGQLAQCEETTSEGKKLETRFKYADDYLPKPLNSAATVQPAILSAPQLVEKNILNRCIEKKRYLNSALVSTRIEDPAVLPSGSVVTASVRTSRGTEPPEEEERRPVHDKFGNPVHIIRRNAPERVLIWGCNGRHLVAEIEGASYAEVSAALGTAPESFSTQAAPSMAALNGLRQSLPAALVTTYTYRPLVGMTSVIRPNGEKHSFLYNSKHELSSVTDHDGKTVESYTKNYKP